MSPTPETRPLWSRLSAAALMVLVLLVAGTISAVTAMRFAIQGGEVTVPDLTAAGEAEAARLLAELDLEFVVDGRRFSATVPEGEIFDQSPPPGARVKQDRQVRVRISLGEREFPVPDVRGTSLRATQLLLAQRGLAVGGTLYSHSGEGDAGTVVFQEPDPGSEEPDPSVNVLVSLGSADQYYVMPALVGVAGDEAGDRIRRAGFRLTEVPDPEASGPSGLVVSQQPPPGHRVSRGDTIVLGVSQ